MARAAGCCDSEPSTLAYRSEASADYIHRRMLASGMHSHSDRLLLRSVRLAASVIVLDRKPGYVARLLGPEDGIAGWQVVEERGPAERATRVMLNQLCLIEQWRIGALRWQP